jgi:hypothetical protein
MRAMFVDLAVGLYSFSSLREHKSLCSKDFLVDVVLLLRGRKNWPRHVGNRKKFFEDRTAGICRYTTTETSMLLTIHKSWWLSIDLARDWFIDESGWYSKAQHTLPICTGQECT